VNAESRQQQQQQQQQAGSSEERSRRRMLSSMVRGAGVGRGLMATSSLRSAGFHAGSVLRHGAGSSCDGGASNPDVKKAIEEYVKSLEVDGAEDFMGSHPELEDLLENNKAWVERMNKNDPTFFEKLGAKQTPRYLYIGCSDARVDPGRLMGLEHGKLFVHRNVGNVVSGTDLNVLSAVDFAVKVLKVPHILVVGHMDCGAVRGSIGQPDGGGLGIVENWLRNIRDVARQHKDELFNIEDPEQRVRRLVELNVMEQCLNVLKIGTVQSARVKSYLQKDVALPRVHGLVFDPANGVLRKLPIDAMKLSETDKDIYSLYQLPEWAEHK